MDNKELYIRRIYYLYYKDKISFLMLKTFIQFLKEKGLVEKFIEGVKNPKFISINNVYNAIYKDQNSLFNEILKCNSLPLFGYYAEELINFAFNWSRTCEGHDFWLNANKEWRNYFNERFSDWKEKQRRKKGTNNNHG